MKWPRLAPGIFSMLSIPVVAAAQVPPEYLVLALRNPSGNATGSAILFIDPVSGTATPVSSQTTPSLPNVSAVAVAGTRLFAIGSPKGGPSLPVFWQATLTANEHGRFLPVPQGGLPANTIPHRIAASSKGLAFTIQGGTANGLYFLDMTTSKVAVGVTVPSTTALAGDVVVHNERAYAAFYNTSATARRGMIYEWVLDGKSKPNAVVSDTTPRLTMCPSPMLLAAGMLILHTVDDMRTAHLALNAPPWLSTPAAAPIPVSGIVGMAVGRSVQAQYYFAVSNSSGGTDVYHWNNQGTTRKIYTDPRPFGDMVSWHFPSTPLQGGVLFYGQGCPGSTTGAPSMVLSGYPSMGTGAFAVAMAGAPANAPCLFAFGSKRTNISLAPNGALGCSLHTDTLVVLGRSTTISGTAAMQVQIPLALSLLGYHAFAQCGIADSGANAAGLITTQGAEYIVY